MTIPEKTPKTTQKAIASVSDPANVQRTSVSIDAVN